MKPMISDAQAPLLRAVQRLFVAAIAENFGRPVAIVVESATSEDWASATYVGQRHRFELRLETALTSGVDAGRGGDADANFGATQEVGAALAVAVSRLTATIGEAEIEMPGHFVADIAVVGSSQLNSGAVRLTLEALTLLN